ncbi:MAG: MBL fold metallo-hydrolase [Deltaproteobacteria bacterium]|nr:MBL fold metallo-hydrolase [Deltaproteobacteria bacterium]
MKTTVSITVLVEERAHRPGLVAEHGWSVWIEKDSRRVLFDVGQKNEILVNASFLGVDLRECDTIVLSHGHYDHCGGLDSVWSSVPDKKVYAHPAALNEKYARNEDGTSRYNGMPRSSIDTFTGSPGRLIDTSKPTDLGSGLFVTGEIPRVSEFEDAGGAYFSDSQLLHPDPIMDDQALFFESADGIVVVLGCAHAGVINTAQYICKLTGDKRIHAILGGMHLLHASQERIQSTIKELERLDPALLGTSHCTGPAATKQLMSIFGEKCVDCCIGTGFVFEMVGTSSIVHWRV